jgi:hypothetical protein
MKTLLAAGAALGLAIAAAPVTAQSTNTTAMASTQMTAAQKAMYDAWPADRRATYDAWPASAKTYYWTLSDQQKQGWWMLNNEQRVRIVEMTPQQRTQAWTAISSQMSGNMANTTTAPASASTTATARAGTTGNANIRFVSNPRVQPVSTTSPPRGELPICTPNQQDDCINRGAR